MAQLKQAWFCSFGLRKCSKNFCPDGCFWACAASGVFARRAFGAGTALVSGFTGRKKARFREAGEGWQHKERQRRQKPSGVFYLFFSLNILAQHSRSPHNEILNSSIAYEKGKLEDHSSDTHQHPDGPGHHARRDQLHELMFYVLGFVF
jgi:hypothetical protein